MVNMELVKGLEMLLSKQSELQWKVMVYGELAGHDSVIIDEIFNERLSKLNPSLSASRINLIAAAIESVPSELEESDEIVRYLTGLFGINLLSDEFILNIKLFDYEDFMNNDFKIMNDFVITINGININVKVAQFVNGIPVMIMI